MASQTRTLVVQALPTIDKYWAAIRQIFDWQKKGVRFVYAFCKKNYPSEEDRVKWDAGQDGSAVLIDVGDRKYHRGWMSASDFQMMASDTQKSHVWNRGVALINLNNQTGFLKALPHSIAAKIREIPHTYQDRDRGEYETFSHGMRALRSMFRPTSVRKWEELHTNPQYARLKEIWDGFRCGPEPKQGLPYGYRGQLEEIMLEMSAKYPELNIRFNDVVELLPWFTLPGYFYRMFVAGEDPGEMMKQLSWWFDREKIAKHKLQQARHGTFAVFEFRVPGSREGSSCRCSLVHVKDYFDAKGFFHQYVGEAQEHPCAVSAMRMPTGGVIIQTCNRFHVDISKLAQILKDKEPDSWYYETRFHQGKVQFLMNQTWQYTEVTPTALTDREIVSLIKDNVVYSGRRR